MTMQSNIDRFTDAIKLIDALFKEEEIFEFRFIGKGKKPFSKWQLRSEAIKRLPWCAEQNAQGYNVYFSACPRSGLGRRKDADVPYGRSTWADFDHVSPEEAEQRIRDAGLPIPTFVINSGHGTHAWWIFGEEIAPEKVRDLNDRAAKLLNSDPSVKNVGRIMRLPSFINKKPPEAECYIVSTGEVVDLCAFETALSNSSTKTAEATTNSLQAGLEGHTLLAGDDPIPEGKRNESLFRLACGMRAKGHEESQIHTQISTINGIRCKPPLPDDELANIATSAASYAPGKEGSRYRLNDIGNGKRLADSARGKYLYCPEFKEWYHFDGTRWSNAFGGIEQKTKEVIDGMYDEVKAADQSDLFKHAKSSSQESHFNAMIRLARTERGMWRPISQFDRDPILLNLPNGTLNPSTGELRPHSPDDYITMITNVSYDVDATCPTFDSFMTRIFNGDLEMILYMQAFAGYCLTGDVSERMMAMWYGNGRNGKTTLAKLLQKMLGDYATTASTSVVLRAPAQSDKTYDIARLKGKRFVTMSESDENHRMSEARMKNVTGNEEIVCRYLYKNPFVFHPNFKLVLLSNYQPEVSAYDQAVWDRIHPVGFDVRIPDEEKDLKLDEKLWEEAPGVLNWAIQGCLRWQAEGLKKPFKVEQAASEYRESYNTIGRFIDDCCQRGGRVANKDLYLTYVKWCDGWESTPSSNKEFGKVLSRLGYIIKKSNGVNYRVGLELKK